jgi:hypothetical protein
VLIEYTEVADDPPGALLLLGVLTGMMDGRVEVPDIALCMARQMILTWRRDHTKMVWVLEVAQQC